MNTLLYSFVGTATAVSFHLGQANPPASATALAASAELQSAAQALMAACGSDTSDENFKAVFADQASTVMTAIETLRHEATASLNDVLNSSLEYFYAAADAVMGGGGDTVWPSSSSSSGPVIGSK